MEATAAEKRTALRKMLEEPTCHLAPSCNDGIQARLVEWLGFPLVHISGSGQHRSLGFADASAAATAAASTAFTGRPSLSAAASTSSYSGWA